MRRNHPKVFVLLLLLFCIITDQITKKLMTALLGAGLEFSLVNDLIQFSLVKNHHGFLGVAAPLPDTLRIALLFGGVSVLALGCLAYLFFARPSRITIPLSLATGGGLSNLLDRLMNNGGVTDFISVGVGSFRTGIFNLADVYIIAGSTLLGYYLFSSSPPARRPGYIDSNPSL